MPAQAAPKYIQQKWLYRIRIQDLTVGHFTTCSSLEGEVDVTEYHQGGDPDPAVQTPGKRKHSPVTLGAGSSDNDDLWVMWMDIHNAQGAGLDLDSLRKQITIEELAEDCETARKTWALNKAIMSKFVAGEFDASSSDNVIQSVTFHYKNLTKS